MVQWDCANAANFAVFLQNLNAPQSPVAQRAAHNQHKRCVPSLNACCIWQSCGGRASTHARGEAQPASSAHPHTTTIRHTTTTKTTMIPRASPWALRQRHQTATLGAICCWHRRAPSQQLAHALVVPQLARALQLPPTLPQRPVRATPASTHENHDQCGPTTDPSPTRHHHHERRQRNSSVARLTWPPRKAQTSPRERHRSVASRSTFPLAEPGWPLAPRHASIRRANPARAAWQAAHSSQRASVG